MKKVLYLECSSGISGDMTVAALLDLGADEKKLRQVLSSIPIDGFHIEIRYVKKSGLNVCDFSVILKEENHDHDMEFLYGHPHEEHSHVHFDEEHMHHEHVHGIQEYVHDAHAHEHRGLFEIKKIIQHTKMTESAKKLAIRIFEILAEAEAKAHGVPMEEVHFHEVGAVDSIVDIVAAAVCLDDLGADEVIVTKLSEGSGMIRCQHGLIPVPVPAVVNIAQAYGLDFYRTQVEGELVTPTGAAIVAAVRTGTKLPAEFRIIKAGLGAGKRKYELPGILRAMFIEYAEEMQEQEHKLTDTVYRLESNIDDCSGENFGYVWNKLMEAGARDVNYIPVFMKKNRPAYQLNVICDKKDIDKIENIIFKETTTIGIRRMEMERTILKRKNECIETTLGKANVKICILPNGEKRCYPEYQSVEQIATKYDLSYQYVYEKIRAEYTKAGK